jgi:hypothetical protein
MDIICPPKGRSRMGWFLTKKTSAWKMFPPVNDVMKLFRKGMFSVDSGYRPGPTAPTVGGLPLLKNTAHSS